MRPMSGVVAAFLAVGLLGCTERNPVFSDDPDAAAAAKPDGASLADSNPEPDLASRIDAISADDQAIVGCESATVTFVLEVHSGGRPDRYCYDSCQNWVSIEDTDGEPRNLPNMMDCIPSCADCIAQPCPGMACMPNPISEPLKRDWSGYYVVGGMCGEGVHCAETRCAPPGKYVATMCASRNMAAPSLGECVPAMPQTCVTVPFVLPRQGTAVVRGKLPAVQ